MSTHNIGFYEDLTKIVFELSSNIIKYAPYFFFCMCYFQMHYWTWDLLKKYSTTLVSIVRHGI